MADVNEAEERALIDSVEKWLKRNGSLLGL